MLFSVIIPTCNRPDSLRLCLECLAPGRQRQQQNTYEVIVSDDGQVINAKALLQHSFPWVRWTLGPKCGPAANRNNGARIAAGEWLVFTDDDCLPDENWLVSYAEAIHQFKGTKAFEGAILPDDWTLLKKDLAECPINTRGGVFWSANIMVNKKLFWDVGGFDERFKIAAQEDQDLFKKLLVKTGVQFVVEALVTHPVRIGSLHKRMKSITVNSLNWHKYYRKDHGLGGTILKAWNSQSLAFYTALRQMKIKATVYHLICLLTAFPIHLYAEFKTAGDRSR